MSEVRQAHLPGNYELYDPSSNTLGPPLCKGCWEEAGIRNTNALQTVWVSLGENTVVWWLCLSHVDAMRTREAGMEILRSTNGVVPSPGI